ncbi:YggS family pyridoxal phosphate-dependent enzyme [Pollutibacter soli]|uniref:YggS family pyridoxal phosphate-dependent enzyme n=1 Tax=Pollutibacter soli TaxID=3034157 RepID=UPI0030135532
MSVNLENFHSIQRLVSAHNATLVAVSKIKPVSDIKALYNQGQLDFGENYVQELDDKVRQLPGDIRWHFIGHLQSNKVKYIAPYVHLVHGVDSIKLLQTIDKEGRKINRKIKCLLQVHVAQEETKFGFSKDEVLQALAQWQNTKTAFAEICGIMGMASFTEDEIQLRHEFRLLKSIFDEVRNHYFKDVDHFDTLSMGMSGDYKIALEEGSTMIRVGSLLFGSRN